eukprot:TRINITY_DN10606_c0_g1_i4.p1 TRINITY_DN10606_c0_g1~~TRINITY_DN10606_c0_g1_i4.p1  ORF type:complete len:130 (-),score=38.44 TRINITY_DN10606_c0_g1_i4:212-601(-)
MAKLVELIKFLDGELRGKINATVQLDILKDGRPAGEYYMVVKPGEVGYKEGKHEKPDFTVIAEDADLIQLLTNKLDPMQAFLGGKIKIQGNLMLGMQIQALRGKDFEGIAKEAFKKVGLEMPGQLKSKL